jgi:hypothetical protein
MGDVMGKLCLPLPLHTREQSPIELRQAPPQSVPNEHVPKIGCGRENDCWAIISIRMMYGFPAPAIPDHADSLPATAIPMKKSHSGDLGLFAEHG